ncbi:hypothetical protein [Roseateles saccharophilus]|uniref:Uncharacterized protein n=1 Tax=Roseateles saccharophilus TaxID=304 RepID=A0A4R3VAM6_ROSSA|nr:hypothetical protein [Roseateles saccharophilus]MDG0835697.1 hypothetical protein [Roseateles saccharophilus]TCV01081.1 hypothetical protein EV671_10067 [Roseateles saccharophilus]
MRLIELRGPDAAETHAAWALRWARIKRAARALRLVFSPAYRRRRRARGPLEFYAEAGAPEGALYIDGELGARLEGVRRL